MAYTKRVWTDRTVERPLTYIMQDNADGTITLIPSEGSIISTGTPITAANMNALEDGVANAHTDIATERGRIDTANTNIATNTSNIATNTSNIATNTSNISNLTTRMGTAEGNISGHESEINTIQNDIYTNRNVPMVYHSDDGALIMQRASNYLYGTATSNGNFLVSVIDTAHAHYWIVGIVHYQNNDYLNFTKIAGNQLTVVTNTLGTISVSGNSGTPRYVIQRLGSYYG